MSKAKQTISIVGYGRFGKVLHRLLKDDFIVTIYRRSKVTDRSQFSPSTIVAETVKDIYKSDVIFYAVPIESFEEVIASHRKYFQEHHLLIDVLSVKSHPAKIFTKYLKGTGIQALLTHPMFGPDSSKNGFIGLPFIMDKFLTNTKNYKFWKDYFAGKGLHIVEMNAKDHDRIAAGSQGLTHFIGRLLDTYGLDAGPIDSLGTKKLLEIKEQTCNDTWQLFNNLQHFNPFTIGMRLKLEKKYDQLFNKLLPLQKNADYLTFGIQGGKGSFNEKAVMHYLEKEKIAKYRIKYLYTSEKVMSALHKGDIDFGQFAIHNSIGGVVNESLKAISRYKFRIVDQFAILISHAIMIRPDAKISDITTILTHPQVLAQCKSTLAAKYPQLIKKSGTGNLVDHALVAKYLSEKKLSKHVATMGSDILAKIYGLKVIDTNLQDAKENFTSFLVVSRL